MKLSLWRHDAFPERPALETNAPYFTFSRKREKKQESTQSSNNAFSRLDRETVFAGQEILGSLSLFFQLHAEIALRIYERKENKGKKGWQPSLCKLV